MNARAPMAATALLAAMALFTAACGGSSKNDSRVTASAASRTVLPAASATTQRPASVSETLAVATAVPSVSTATPASATSVATVATAAPTATTAPPPPTATPVPPTPTAVPTSAYPMAATITALTTAFQWSPADVTIGAGGTVTWSWAGDTFHDLASSDGNFNPGFPDAPMKSWTGSVTFHSPGVYKYLCTVHTNSRTSMRGTITVR